MSSFFIYKTKQIVDAETKGKQLLTYTVIFCYEKVINQKRIINEVKDFYENHHQTDFIVVIGGEYQREQLQNIFIDNAIETFRFVPKGIDILLNSIYIYEFDKFGTLRSTHKSIEGSIDKLVSDGLKNIFINRGGLIESAGSHHFVFPSGKHCDKFLRTGNILLYSSEIYFISFNLLKFLKSQNLQQIYCDTSSINTIAFALMELHRRFDDEFEFFPIESFGSYDAFEKETIKHGEKSLFIISASTSCNIIDRLLKHVDNIVIDNIAMLYYLGTKETYLSRKNQIICNLTRYEADEFGVDSYETYNEINCNFCKEGSLAVRIVGDVFLLEKPKVNLITLNKTDAPVKLSGFVEEFTKEENLDIITCHFKENTNPDNKYEIYFDLETVFNNLNSFNKFGSRYEHIISSFISYQTKYLIYLPDKTSILLAKEIIKSFNKCFPKSSAPQLIDIKDIEKIDSKGTGKILIIGAAAVLGKNLLLISKTLRNISNYNITYVVSLARTKNEEYLNFLKKNLGQGKYGIETYPFVYAYDFYCSDASKNTVWHNEIDFLKELLEYADNAYTNSPVVDFILDRIQLFNKSPEKKGVSSKLFLPNYNTLTEIRLQNNFAFFNFDYKKRKISQSVIYFTISCVLNNLRNLKSPNRSLVQTEYTRNLLDPSNFQRYNEGVIQAAILRAATTFELAYNIDETTSAKMLLILENIVKGGDDGLFEFVYALISGKLKLMEKHYLEIEKRIRDLDNEYLNLYLDFKKYREEKHKGKK